MTTKEAVFWAAVQGSYKRARRDPRETFKNMGKGLSTYYNRAKAPDTLTVEELRALIKEGRLSQEDIINYLY